VQTWLLGQYPTFYQQGFEKWISRLDNASTEKVITWKNNEVNEVSNK
jgi:hypothetical protein